MPSTVILEIGTEEIPAAPLVSATTQMKDLAAKAFADERIDCASIETMSTPRRMILIAHEVAEQTQALSIRAKGPAADIAFDDEGNPTKAAKGFARGKGVDVSELERVEEGGREYVYAVIEEPARQVADILPGLFSELIAKISWPKSQRWGSCDAHFSRPVRWLLALDGEQVLPVEFAGLVAGDVTWGHRLLANHEFKVTDADAYLGVLADAKVIPSADERARIIREGIASFEERHGLKARTPQGIFTEVVNLVEYPTVLLGHFDEEFLEVPSEIITDAMLSHQRYFPLYDAEGGLSNAFLLVSNGDPARGEVITDGNERVVRARLYDAKFFYEEDKKRPLADYVPELDKVVFQEKLGSIGDKTARIEKLVDAFCVAGAAEGEEAVQAKRAAHLCKADLVTSAVIEFTSQQGIMGGYYAKASGEDPEVALAVSQHYMPRFAGDELPANTAGRLVALADKLDTVCGIFAADQAPTGSSDPFAVRRCAIGVINILLAGMRVSLADAIANAMSNLSAQLDFDVDAVTEQVRGYFIARLEVIARDRGFAADVVAAVLATGVLEPVQVLDRCAALSAARTDSPEVFGDLATAYTRAAHLADTEVGMQADEGVMTEADKALLEGIEAAEAGVGAALAAHDYPAAIDALAALRAPIDRFFEDVLVMDEDERVRAMRLALLNRFVSVFGSVADIGKLASK
ncbi:MAG: glycine--tRNA ligase subunit beta [Actinomycetota bacterium]|nr:glycine--tRNA ligase subunit beta [Actinomycetota bacterium]